MTGAFVRRCLSSRALLRFHTPLIEPDVRVSRIRLSEKEFMLAPTGRSRPSRVARVGRRGRAAIPSRRHAASSATPERLTEWIGSSPISCRPSSLPSLLLQPRPLRSTGVTRLHRYYEPLRHPSRPGSGPRGPPVRGGPTLRRRSAPIGGTSRVDAGVLAHMPSPLPRRNRQILVIHRPEPALRLTAAAFPIASLGRLPHQLFRGLDGVHGRYGLRARGAA